MALFIKRTAATQMPGQQLHQLQSGADSIWRKHS